MTVMLEVPSTETLKTFDKAMIALSGQQGDRQDRTFGHLPPFRRSVVSRIAAAEADLSAAKQVGWQYLVNDSLGLAVVDISDQLTTTFSSVRRGQFAKRYESILGFIDADCENTEEIFLPSVLEVPQLGACAILVHSTKRIYAYPVILSGDFTPVRRTEVSEFFEMTISPTSSLKSNRGTAPPI